MAFTLPALPYAFNALEPHIDARTMEIHHGKHHNAYVTNLNNAVAGKPEENLSIEEICKSVSKYPPAVRNNGGGHDNHTFFWTILGPNASGSHPVRLAKRSIQLLETSMSSRLNSQPPALDGLVQAGHG